MKMKLKRVFAIIDSFLAFIQLIKDPTKLDRVFDISQKISEPNILNKMGSHAAQNSIVAKN